MLNVNSINIEKNGVENIYFIQVDIIGVKIMKGEQHYVHRNNMS